MPKGITPPENVYSWPDRRRCVAKAKRAAALRPAFPFTPDQILLLAEVGMNPRCLGRVVTSEGGKKDIDQVNRWYAAELVSLMAQAPAPACRVILAAQREAERIRTTKLWAIRRAIREIVLLDRLKTNPLLDCQRIQSFVKRDTHFDVSVKLIHKALRAERAVTGTEDADQMPSFAPPCSEEDLARGLEMFGSDFATDSFRVLRARICTFDAGKRDKLPKVRER